jgi:outer membrane protein OmpA-like peptidoglycan-associated protein
MKRLMLAIAIGAALSGCGVPKKDINTERLLETWDSEELRTQRETVPDLAAEAQSLVTQIKSPDTQRDKGELGYLLERKIAIVETGASLERDRIALNELERQISTMRIELADIAANKAHLESERIRLQAAAQAEEAEALLAAERQRAEEEVRTQTEAADLAREEARIAREMADIQAREAELARKEAELRGDQVAALERQIAGLKAVDSSRGKTLILGDAFFSSGQGELNAVAKKNLKPVLDFLKKYPNLPVSIEGHSDGKGSASGNQKLSALRAESVRKNLIAQGADAARLKAVGFGETLPVASNDTDSGRAKNRRVEIVIEGAK